MTIEQNIARLAEAQERTASALEAILATLTSGTLTAIPATDDAPKGDPSKGTVAASAAEIAEAKKKADAAAKKKADADAAAKKKAEEDAAAEAAAAEAAAAEVDPLDEPAEEEVKTYTIDEVREALKNYRAIEGSPAMLEVLKTHGKVDALSALKVEDYAAVMKAIS